jgi:SAM-dependent methyltransferase
VDAIQQLKEAARQSWKGFGPFEVVTMTSAPILVDAARIAPGARLLDVACGTGVVAVTAAHRGARVTGLDLVPELIEQARAHAEAGGLAIDFHVGDAEALPFADAAFDVVVSQFGHMFAPRPAVAIGEMLRVLRPGGTIAFSTWPPELFVGRMFALLARYLPPMPPGASAPPEWGDPETVRARLGDAVEDVRFDRATQRFPALTPAHQRAFMERHSPPVGRVLDVLAGDPERQRGFRAELEALAADYFDPSGNVVRQDFLVTRARKKP